MALSGSVTTSSWTSSGGQTRSYTLSWTATQNTSTNKSTINWTLKTSGTYPYNVAERTVKAVIAGTTVYSKTERVMRDANTTVANGSIELTHNSDGTKSFSVSLQAAVYTSAVNCTGSNTFTLNTIPRASSISATSAYVGENSTITISRASSAFTHTLTYSFGSLTGTIATKTSNTSVSFAIPTTFYAQIGATATSKNGTITCTTYNGSTSLGSKTCTLTVKTRSTDCQPTLSPTVEDTNAGTIALTGDKNKLIIGFSNASVSTGAVARNSATLSSQRVTCGNDSITTATGTFDRVSTATFVFSATDSRGYTTTQTVDKTAVNYVRLSNTFDASITVDGVATVTASGNYFNNTFGAVANTLTVQYRYRKGDDAFTDWFTMPHELNGNKYDATVTISGLDYKETYHIQTRAQDKLISTQPNPKSVKALPVFDWGEDDFNFNVPVSIQGVPLADYIVEEGVDDIWTYRKWNNGIAECWGTYIISTTINNAWGALYESPQINPVSFPFTFKETPFLTMTPASGSYVFFVEVGAGADTTKTGIIWVSRPTSVTSPITCRINIHAIGKWK